MQRTSEYISSYVYYPETKRLKSDSAENPFEKLLHLPEILVKIFKKIEFAKLRNSAFYLHDFLSTENYGAIHQDNNYLQYLNIALVCKRFKDCVSDALINRINEKKLYIDRNIGNLVREYGTKFQLLSLPNIKLDLIEKCPHLIELNLGCSGIKGTELTSIFSKTLKLTLPSKKMRYEELVTFNKHFPNITWLNASNTKFSKIEFFDAIEKYFPKLIFIQINPRRPLNGDDYDESLDEKFIQDWMQNECSIEKIEELYFGNSWGSKVTDECVTNILKTFPNLKTLDLACSRVSFERVMNKAQITSLKKLELSETKVNEAGLWKIVQLFPNLEELHLSVCVGSTLEKRLLNDGLAPLKLLTKLNSLELCKRLKDEDQFKEFEKALPNVQISFY